VLGGARCFVSRDATVDETLMTIVCGDLEYDKEKVHVKVEPSSDGADHLKVSDDVDQPFTSYMRRSTCAKVDPNYQLTRDIERRTIKPIQRFRYTTLINYLLTTTNDI